MSDLTSRNAGGRAARVARIILVAALFVTLGWALPAPARADVVVNGLRGDYYTATPGTWAFETLRASVLDGEINHANLNPTYEELTGRTTDVGVSWTGQLTAPTTGEYTFHAIGDNGFRLWVDDVQLIDFWVNEWDKEQTSPTITLTAGEPVNFRLDNFQATGGANMFLRWSGPGIEKQIVPVSAFTPPADFELPPATGVTNAAGDTITLNFGGALTGTAGLADQLSILIDGAPVDVASVTAGGDGTSLVLTTDTLIQQGTKVRVAYDGAGSLAVDGVALEEFEAPVTNNSTYTLRTRWADDVDPDSPLPEYPRPLVTRPDWQNLNGTWEFQALSATTATPFGTTLPERVVVPYPIESLLSGIQRHEDHMAYRRSFTVPAGWNVAQGKRIILHFDAVDQEATVFVNGTQVAHHVGGYSRFSADITDQLKPTGSNELVVRVTDTTTDIVRGKQAKFPSGIFYTPSSGIWRTVWMEPVAAAFINDLTLTPDLAAKALNVTADSATANAPVTVKVKDKGGAVVGTASGVSNTVIAVPMASPHLWSPEDPYLYDVEVTLGSDTVRSYAGMRSIALEEINGAQRIVLNGERTFLLSTLDQGFWPDGIYTAPTDEALRWDIEVTKELGFNTIRKHIKVEPDRWYYHADQLGMLVWQDMPSNGELRNLPEEKRTQFKAEARQMVDDLNSFPSIIGWVPMNEGWGEWNLTETGLLADAFKAWDPSRLVNAHSGMNCCASLGDSGRGDIIDHHLYTGPANPMPDEDRAAIDGEHGGFSLSIPGHVWPGGSVNPYGEVASREALTQAYVANTARLIRPAQTTLSGSVYTQLTDLEGEVNGFFTYDRDIEKMDFAAVRAINEKVISVGGADPVVIPEPGPLSGLAHWPTDEGQGSTAADVVGDHDLTLTGATWVDEANGEPGKAVKFDGTAGSYAEATVPALDTTGDYTVSAWARMDQLPANYATVASMDGVDGRSAFFLQYGQPVGGFAFSFADGPRAVSPTGAVLGQWYHLVGVRDARAGTISLYLDGKHIATEASIGSNLGTGRFAIGRGQWDGARVDPFNGAVDDVRLWDRALTAEEVASVHAGRPLEVYDGGTVTATVTQATATTPARLTLQGQTAGTRVEYRLAGGAWTAYTGPVTLAAGTYDVSWRATSPNGQTSQVWTRSVTITASPSPTPTQPPVHNDHYTTPGLHTVGGRLWFTRCEPYSLTIRCRTEIWSTVVSQVNGRFVAVTGWHFNSLTYLPFMTRQQWGSSHLANAGEYTIAGRRWRTECDTASTGRNNCRSYIWASYIGSARLASGGYRHFLTSGWLLNNMVRFKVS